MILFFLRFTLINVGNISLKLRSLVTPSLLTTKFISSLFIIPSYEYKLLENFQLPECQLLQNRKSRVCGLNPSSKAKILEYVIHHDRSLVQYLTQKFNLSILFFSFTLLVKGLTIQNI